MVPIIGGRLGDDRGRRRVLLIGIAAFTVFSVGRRAGAERGGARRRAGPPGAGRRAHQPAGVRDRPAAVPAARARPCVRRHRHGGGRRERGRAGRRRLDRRARRRDVGLAAVLPRQPPRRADGVRALPRLVAEPAAERGAPPPRPAGRGPARRRGLRRALPVRPVRREPRRPAGGAARAGPARAGGLPLVGAGAGAPARPSLDRPRALPGALVRGRRRPRAALLLRLHRDAAGPRVLPPGRARLLGAPLAA